MRGGDASHCGYYALLCAETLMSFNDPRDYRNDIVKNFVNVAVAKEYKAKVLKMVSKYFTAEGNAKLDLPALAKPGIDTKADLRAELSTVFTQLLKKMNKRQRQSEEKQKKNQEEEKKESLLGKRSAWEKEQSERKWQLDERERILKEKESRSRSRSRSKSPVNDSFFNWSDNSEYEHGISMKKRDVKKPRHVLPPSKRTVPARTEEQPTPSVQCLEGADFSRNKSTCIEFALKV